MKLQTYQPRGYTLPLDLIETIDARTKNRTMLVNRCIKEALQEPMSLVKTFERRLSTEQNNSMTKRITISMSSEAIKDLSELSRMTQLGTEFVLRLAIENYLHKTD
jgi:hypothetical protein